jgi:hypothetical protein
LRTTPREYQPAARAQPAGHPIQGKERPTMTVTWHWSVNMPHDAFLHARRLGSAGTLCGAEAIQRAVMRPPFFEARCEACELARSGEEETFPNSMLPGVASDR